MGKLIDFIDVEIKEAKNQQDMDIGLGNSPNKFWIGSENQAIIIKKQIKKTQTRILDRIRAGENPEVVIKEEI